MKNNGIKEPLEFMMKPHCRISDFSIQFSVKKEKYKKSLLTFQEMKEVAKKTVEV